MDVRAMGEYWHPGRPERTELGRLVQAVKDEQRHDAIPELVDRLMAWAPTLGLPASGVLVAVPASPDRPNPALTEVYTRFAALVPLETAPALLRRHATPRLRDLAPADRPAMATAAGYQVLADCRDRTIVLIDDVVLTGTTLEHVGRLLLDAGATSVVGLALARSRRADPG